MPSTRNQPRTTKPPDVSPSEPILPLVVLAVTIAASFTGAGAWQLARNLEQKAQALGAERGHHSFPYEHEAEKLRRVARVSRTVAGAGWVVGGVLVLRRFQRRRSKNENDPGVSGSKCPRGQSTDAS